MRKKQSTFLYNISCLIQHAFAIGIELTLGEGFRTQSQQLLYYHGYDVVPVAGGIALSKTRKLSKTLNSKHADRLAIDLNFFVDGKLTYDFDTVKAIGDYWESLHPDNVWGGDFNKNDIADGFVDTPHFEMR
jgi:hypothetical protein